MNNINDKDIDKMLDEVKNTPIPEEEFKSTEEFEKEFFKRVAKEGVAEKKKIRPALKIIFTAVAAMAVCSCILPAFIDKSDDISPLQNTADTTAAESKFDEVLPAAEHSAVCDAAALVERSFAPKRKMALENSAPSFSGGLRKMPAASIAFNTEEYKAVVEKGFISTLNKPLSTFGADVDTASYANVRRYLQQYHRLPPKDAVRSEEMINYFTYDYPQVQGKNPFNVTFESMDAPWAPERKLLLAGIQAKDVEQGKLPESNFVFLIDNSGSMYGSFPIVIEALKTLADKLRECDRISIVTYGGGVTVLLDGGSGKDKAAVKKQIENLSVGGFTPGGAGIKEAYRLAHKHFIKGGNNRVVLITDGDFNVGASSESELVSMIEKQRKSAVYLSAFGVGMGNYKDNKLKMLANKGNGNYTYLDNIREARRVMNNEMTGKMFALARDVKIQIEFNPAVVAAYRLIGYEMRELADRDFNDDTKDSGEVGVGHQVTAVYELIMNDAPEKVKKQYIGDVDKLEYQKSVAGNSSAVLTFKLRYQKVEGNEQSSKQMFILKELPETKDNIRWAAAVAEFSMLLRNSEYKGNADYTLLLNRARKLIGNDSDGKRAEFLTLVKMAEECKK
ncbi:MAG: DUF3520 domain-containing protein [Lentisphaerae bacterium]|nr:DUF3520 domain-containing protein [Lentisphaerota bacterium]